jgi:hypothetical protein
VYCVEWAAACLLDDNELSVPTLVVGMCVAA